MVSFLSAGCLLPANGKRRGCVQFQYSTSCIAVQVHYLKFGDIRQIGQYRIGRYDEKSPRTAAVQGDDNIWGSAAILNPPGTQNIVKTCVSL